MSSRRNPPVTANTRGRRGAKMRLPLKKHNHKKSLVLLLSGVSVLLLVAAMVVYLLIYHEGDVAGKSAQNLLNQYNLAVSQSPSAITVAVTASPPKDDDVQPEQPDVTPEDALVSLSGYDVIGKLRIDKVGLELPVISEASTKALRASICFYGGARPGQKGNMIITGHNYANGAHFGRLDQLKADDIVEFDASDKKVYRYEVYETLVVKPDDLAALNKYQGDYALSLVTCASSGNRRLLVRCRLISN